MTSDAAIPNLESTKAFSDEEAISVSNTEENSILPETEIDSVLLYLKSNPTLLDVESDSVVQSVESHPVISEVESNPVDTEFIDLPSLENGMNRNLHVQIKTEEGRLLLILPTQSQSPASEYNWSDIWQQMKLRLLAGARFFSPNTDVHLVAQDRLLDGRQLQELAETLNQFQIQLKSVSTSRRQTAIVAATAGYSVEQLQLQSSLSETKLDKPLLTEPLYIEKTVRSGEEIRHPGNVILLGDLNPGGFVVADGDILVWGRLRGIAHAGALGNRECLIMALQMEPTQLRIANAVARAPEKSPMQFYPEVAYITSQGIRIARATDFSRTLFNKDEG